MSTPVAEFPLYEADASPPNNINAGTVSLAGRTFILDPTKGFVRQTLEMRKASQDQAATPGQQTLTDAGLWHRSQTDWTLGAGQKYFDRTDSSSRRFWTSKGVNPWVEGELSLLNDTERVLSTSESNLHTVTVGEYCYVCDGTTLKRTTNMTTFSSLAVGSRPKGITSDGAYVYVISDEGVFRTLVGSASLSQFSTFSGDAIVYANGRLIAADGARLVEIDADGVAGGDDVLDFMHTNKSFQWTALVGAPNAIYAAGYVGDRSQVYAITANTNTGGLRVPVFADDLPDGEVVNCVAHYGSLVGLGTSRGFRFAQISGSASLIHGPVVEIPGGVNCFEPQAEYVWFGWSNYDQASTGLGRIGLAELTAPLVPAYASDLMATTQGRVVSVATFGERRVFTVAGSGLWVEQATPVASGTLDGGTLEWSTFAQKTAAAFELRHKPLVGTITAYTVDENATRRVAGKSHAAGSLSPSPFELSSVHGESVNPVVELAAESDKSPTLRRWTVSAVVRPHRQDRYVLPILFLENLADQYDVREAFDVVEQMRFLKSLEQTGQVITQTIGADTVRVQIDQIVQGGDNQADWNSDLSGLTGVVLVHTITQGPGI